MVVSTAVRGARVAHQLGELEHRELLGELVEDAELAGLRGMLDAQLHARHGVADVEEAARLSAACRRP